MHERAQPAASTEWFARASLVLSVAALYVLLLAVLFGDRLYLGRIIEMLPIKGAGHDGVELALFPLAVAMTVMSRPRLGALATLRAGRLGPALPLLAAAALAALLWYLGCTWVLDRQWYSPERLLGAGLVATAGVVGSVLFPRHTAVLAGAIGAPVLFGAAVVAFPGLLLYPVDNPAEERGARGLLLAAAGVASLLLLAASIRLRPHVLSHAAWSGAITLLVGVRGYLVQTYD